MNSHVAVAVRPAFPTVIQLGIIRRHQSFWVDQRPILAFSALLIYLCSRSFSND